MACAFKQGSFAKSRVPIVCQMMLLRVSMKGSAVLLGSSAACACEKGSFIEKVEFNFLTKLKDPFF